MFEFERKALAEFVPGTLVSIRLNSITVWLPYITQDFSYNRLSLSVPDNMIATVLSHVDNDIKLPLVMILSNDGMILSTAIQNLRILL